MFVLETLKWVLEQVTLCGCVLLIQERGVLALDGGPGWRELCGSLGDKWQELMGA